jgi:hypothetical protein
MRSAKTALTAPMFIMIMPGSTLRAATGHKKSQNTHRIYPIKIEYAQVMGGAPGRIRTCDRRIRSGSLLRRLVMSVTCAEAVRLVFGQSDHSVYIPDLDAGPSAQEQG